MKLSIIICTHNNYEMLASCLENLYLLGYMDKHDILVVDNSRDEQTQKHFVQDVLPTYSVRYTESFPIGLSHARNTGYEQALGDIVAYIDDDAFPQQGWDRAILQSFAQKDVGFVGGPVEPLWERTPPEWMPHDFIGAYTVVDHGAHARYLQDNENIVGANMAFRKKILYQSKGFDTSLGRVGNNLLSNEEVNFIQELRKTWKGYYHPSAHVKHFVDKSRITQEWLLRRMAWQGLSECTNADMLEWKKNICVNLTNTDLAKAVQVLLQPATTALDMAERLHFSRFMGDFLFRTQKNAIKNYWASIPRADIAFETLLYKPEVLFAEFASHSDLYSGFAYEPETAFLYRGLNCWEQKYEVCRNILALFDTTQKQEIEHLVFMTLSPYFWFTKEELEVFSNSGNTKLYSFVHQEISCETPVKITAFEKYFEKIFVFHEITQRFIVKQFPELDHKLFVVPHPFIHLSNFYAQNGVKRRTIRDNKITLGFLGGFRQGKGFEECIAMLARLPFSLRDKIHCLFAGGVPNEETLAPIRSLLAGARISFDFQTGVRGSHPNDYKGISNVDFAQAILESDILMLPYHGPQANAFSGLFSDGLAAGCAFMANKGSLMGDVIEETGLGAVFSLEDQESLEVGMEEVIATLDKGGYRTKQTEYILQHRIFEVNKVLLEQIVSSNGNTDFE